MTESDWLTSTDPAAMLRLYTSDEMPWPAGTPAPIVSDRKLRLFACACCRQVWDRLIDLRSRTAVHIAEQFADGRANANDLLSAHTHAYDAWGESDPTNNFAGIARYAAVADVRVAAKAITRPRLVGIDYAGMAAILRDIFGNPWRPETFTREIGPDMSAYETPPWLTPAVVGMARAIYDDCTFGDLPALADLLEEAGCTATGCIHCGYGNYINMDSPCHCADSEILLHLRQERPHVRGCWALDILLSKS